jgi:cobalamin biosynthesis Mg chelatase CobN
LEPKIRGSVNHVFICSLFIISYVVPPLYRSENDSSKQMLDERVVVYSELDVNENKRELMQSKMMKVKEKRKDKK